MENLNVQLPDHFILTKSIPILNKSFKLFTFFWKSHYNLICGCVYIIHIVNILKNIEMHKWIPTLNVSWRKHGPSDLYDPHSTYLMSVLFYLFHLFFFNCRYETTNGIKTRQTSYMVGNDRVTSGYYSYIGPDSKVYTVHYVRTT